MFFSKLSHMPFERLFARMCGRSSAVYECIGDGARRLVLVPWKVCMQVASDLCVALDSPSATVARRKMLDAWFDFPSIRVEAGVDLVFIFQLILYRASD